ncbi:hypothetical protein [Granulicella aggregans]|uniref:hypothetical protein n=1 Tax=Granulicella aggregans TaxID=474949 RepID=UPI0021DFD7AE|nr:hypothetical protein [Granulicella aggregans]
MKAGRGARRAVGTGMAAGAFALAAGAPQAGAQMPIGSVATVDAVVAGTTATDNQRSVLLGNVTVTAKDHPAYVELFRGGSVKVCSTSGVHLTAGNPVVSAPPKQEIGPAGSADSKPATADATAASVAPTRFPLMVSLDRGAAELHTSVLMSDVMMTPDLRVSFSEDGPLDLRVRVANNGDTCIENRVAGMGQHPTLEIGSLFGNDNYRVLPGQHVLFEHGNLHEVVDNESSPCGCPDQPVKTIEAAPDLSLLPGTKTPTPPQPAAQYPFPAAVSQGLAPPPPPPQAEPGVVHTQVATTLVYKADNPTPPPVPADENPKEAAKVDTKPKPAQRSTGFFGGIGRFFKRVFGGG